ncbi:MULTISPECIES: phosphotransferase family protein [unclassified Streptomyces]|uniref:phosphotransferase family protein n=1 Tax=unclassified Streptomyces TaxID=2593676 RepID=UPI002E802E81|nr:phosphotransferase family protein [Streptomyces sp. NBC_00589]WTI42946.1 phosphotransferase family protein [Streptomyces sp. NBC_00775]WUB32839.1 phosphotransferase family protein [Streptomyces sp. NBC_00589]
MRRILGPIPRKDLPRGVVLDREQTAALCRNVVDLLVDLHEVDLTATGLGDLGKGGWYVSRQVEGWSERYRKARTWNVGGFERVMRWLADNQPADRPHTLVHNDFRFDNVVLDAEDPTRPVGLLDWELATVGDPLMDLANGLGYWVQADDGRHMQAFRRQPTHLPGMMTREEVVAHYCGRTGTSVTNREWAWTRSSACSASPSSPSRSISGISPGRPRTSSSVSSASRSCCSNCGAAASSPPPDGCPPTSPTPR